MGDEAIQQQDDIYFLDSDDEMTDRMSKAEVGRDKAGLSVEDEVDLQRARVSAI